MRWVSTSQTTSSSCGKSTRLAVHFPHGRRCCSSTTLIIRLLTPWNPLSFEEIVKLAKIHRLIVVHDFAYGKVTFDGYQAPSFLATPGALEVGVEFTSMSKSFNMAGWRIGFCAGNAKVVDALGAIKGYYDYGIFQAIQIASIIALRECDDFTQQQAERYAQRRNVLLEGLGRAGWEGIEVPRAGMFVWAPIPKQFASMGSMEFSRQLMEDAEVAVAPGAGFGPEGEGFVRIALIENRQRLSQAGPSNQTCLPKLDRLDVDIVT